MVKMKKISVRKILLSSLAGMFFSSTFADVVKKIKFEGLDRVEVAVLEDAILIHPNKDFTQDDIDNTIKALFKKGFFDDIKITKSNDTLVIHCVERPMVDQVDFEGNDAASDDALKSVIANRLGSGRLFSLYLIKDILADFQGLYRALGYSSAVINPKIVKHPGNKVDIVFEISEGEKTTIKKIFFVGNKHFSDDDLKDVMTMKEERIWRFWNYESHIFREDKAELDTNTITSYYKNSGYPFFVITLITTEMSPDKRSHYCTIMMEEGDKFTIGDVNLKSDLKNVNVDELKKLLLVTKGGVYNEALIDYVRKVLINAMALKDNPFIDVAVDVSFDKDKKTASVTYVIIEKPKMFIDRIDIHGNTRTLDHVIRRELSVHEGDAWNSYKIHNSVERLRGIGHFNDVEVSDEDGSAEDRKVLKIKVREREGTASFQGGLTASTMEGFGGVIGVVESNLMGTGRVLSAEMSWVQKRYGAKVDLFDPRFMGQNFGAGLGIGYSSLNRKNVSQSVNKSAFISPYVSYSITNNLFHSIRLSFSMNHKHWWDEKTKKMHSSVPKDEDVLLRDEFGKYTAGELSSTLTYDKTDGSLRNGYSLSMTNSFAGLVGNVRYIKNEFNVKYYRPITSKITFVADLNFGHIHEGTGTRITHRFALGGDGGMRGFDVDGVGPHDFKGNSIGGTKYWTLSFMARAPIARELGVNGVLFTDLGSAWGTNAKFDKAQIQDSSSVRASVGVGIEWVKSPLGMPMTFIFAFPIKKQPFDERRTFTLAGLM